MNLQGAPEGLAELRKIKEERKDYLRFLITEAKTSISHSAEFVGSDGQNWVLLFDPHKNELRVQLRDAT